MALLQIASAFADTVKTGAGSSQATGNGWLAPAFIGGIIGAIIAATGAFFAAWWILRKQWAHEAEQKKADEEQEKLLQGQEEETDESRYLEWVTNQHRFLPITGLRTRSPVEVELERVYVSLNVDPRVLERMGSAEEDKQHEMPPAETLSVSRRREEKEAVSIADALKLIDRNRVFGLVILGGPGTGKTTVLKYLALTYARGLYGERLDQPRPRLPVFVPLREIATEKPARSLADYLAEMCSGAGCKLSSDFLDGKLVEGRRESVRTRLLARPSIQCVERAGCRHFLV